MTLTPEQNFINKVNNYLSFCGDFQALTFIAQNQQSSNLLDQTYNEIQRGVEGMRCQGSESEVFIVFINEEFDFASNFFLVDTYLSLITLVADNEQILSFL